MSDDVERENRKEALSNAVRHRLGTETAETVVQNAEKYLAFLEGKTESK